MALVMTVMKVLVTTGLNRGTRGRRAMDARMRWALLTGKRFCSREWRAMPTPPAKKSDLFRSLEDYERSTRCNAQNAAVPGLSLSVEVERGGVSRLNRDA